MKEVQALLGQKHIVITDVPMDTVGFDEDGLQILTNLDARIDIRGKRHALDLIRSAHPFDLKTTRSRRTIFSTSTPIAMSSSAPQPSNMFWHARGIYRGLSSTRSRCRCLWTRFRGQPSAAMLRPGA